MSETAFLPIRATAGMNKALKIGRSWKGSQVQAKGALAKKKGCPMTLDSPGMTARPAERVYFTMPSTKFPIIGSLNFSWLYALYIRKIQVTTNAIQMTGAKKKLRNPMGK